MRYTRSELASMKGRTGHYRKKALNGGCTRGEYERGMKDGRRAFALMKNADLDPGDEKLVHEILYNVKEMSRAMDDGGSAGADHEFGIRGVWF